MKKILSMILACIMALSLLTACGGGGNDQPAQTEPPKQDEPAPAPEKTPRSRARPRRGRNHPGGRPGLRL